MAPGLLVPSIPEMVAPFEAVIVCGPICQPPSGANARSTLAGPLPKPKKPGIFHVSKSESGRPGCKLAVSSSLLIIGVDGFCIARPTAFPNALPNTLDQRALRRRCVIFLCGVSALASIAADKMRAAPVGSPDVRFWPTGCAHAMRRGGVQPSNRSLIDSSKRRPCSTANTSMRSGRIS